MNWVKEDSVKEPNSFVQGLNRFEAVDQLIINDLIFYN